MDQFPKTRTQNLIIQGFEDELLVYDRQRHKAHCLNRTAALIWKHCDGRTSVAEISRALGKEIETEVEIDEQIVWHALRQFERDHLLEARVVMRREPVATMSAGVDRRRVMRMLGLSAMIALPLVTSMVAPTAAEAATCTPANGVCSASAQCCSGLCNQNTCI
jgi:hypothetical protein